MQLTLKCSICVILVFLGVAHSYAQQTYPLMVTTPQGQACFDVEVADTIWSRSKGLMYRNDIHNSGGMVFLYDNETPVSFWMKNVILPLDLIFISKAGTVVKIHHNAKPFDLTPIESKVAVSAVLGIRGGASASAQITLGNQVDMTHVMLRTIEDCSSIIVAE